MNDLPGHPPPARLKRVLVLHDFHANAENAAWRGGMLARAHGGWLRILHLGRFGDPAAARERLQPLAWRLQEHLQVGVLVQCLRGSFAGELRRAAEEADLVVTRAPSGLDAATGLHPLRALQLAGRPILVVRAPAATAYRRALVGAEPLAGELPVQAATTMTDGKELPITTPLLSTAALLERERTLLPDLVVLPGALAPSAARRFLSLTKVDTLLLPLAAAGLPRAGFGHGVTPFVPLPAVS